MFLSVRWAITVICILWYTFFLFSYGNIFQKMFCQQRISLGRILYIFCSVPFWSYLYSMLTVTWTYLNAFFFWGVFLIEKILLYNATIKWSPNKYFPCWRSPSNKTVYFHFLCEQVHFLKQIMIFATSFSCSSVRYTF